MPDSRWADVLDDLERRLSLGDASRWTPPAGLGPLPSELASRARALLSAQQEGILRAEAGLQVIGEELSALRRSGAVAASWPSAYIDTVA